MLAARIGGRFKAHKARADVVEGRIAGGPRVVLAKPKSFMNLSGGPVVALRDFFKVAAGADRRRARRTRHRFGTVRLKRGGGDNGHNGLRSITTALGTQEYLRVRFGIGRPPGRQDPADFVLKDFSSVENKDLDFHVDRAADAVEDLIRRGLVDAQNIYHAV